jgi:mono/diheme cytochrome c family protein
MTRLSLGGMVLLAGGTAMAWLWMAGLTAWPQVASPDGRALYATHCTACHGDQGDGNGIAARFLYPKPRDFSAAEFRLVSTTNLVPTDDDLLRVITRGMPGSAMFPFGHLSEPERKALVEHVKSLTRDGMLRKAVADARTRGETPDENDLKQQIAEFFTPGPRHDLPAQWPAADKASIERGKALYAANCATCHGPTGKGDGAQDQVDSSGIPTRPRDFGRGIFKGGRDREQLYARIALGMKGTPMPSSPSLKPVEICDLVHFIHSMSADDAQLKVEHRRMTITARRIEGALDRVWWSTPPVPIVLTPLWWRDTPDPDLRVAAVHDGRTLAMRLTWVDPTCDDRIARTEDFEDMASVQLFDRRPEPFLGMGADNAAPDLWLWRATWGRPRDATNSLLDDYPFDTPEYRQRLGASKLPDLLTARAAGNPHARPDESQTAGHLAAKGPGSVTFRPKASQVVSAKATWSEGRWTVEFRRPLRLKAGDGISVEPGQSASVAFALWDGAARDRNGQKLTSIWHDLRVD